MKFLIAFLSVILLVVLLSGCSERVVYQVKYEKVAVPTPQPCVEKGMIPLVPDSQFDSTPVDASQFRKTKALLADREKLRPVVQQLRLIAVKCSALTP